jgi:hypothetical protein
MTLPRFRRAVRASLLVVLPFSLLSIARAQGAKKTVPETPIADADSDHEKERSEWFLRGRVIPGKSSAELRYHAYQAKMLARRARLAGAGLAGAGLAHPNSQPPPPGAWTPLGPVPLASDATGDGFQDYHQVSGRATAVAIDPADPTGNTLYIGGAQGGVWKSVNAADTANNVTWTALTDDQATLSIGSIVIQPGNTDPTESVVLVGTGEADNSADSYFGLGMLRSADGGNTWAPIISTANSGALSFSGLGATRMAFSTASGQTGTVVAAMAATAEGVTDGALTSNTYRGLYTSTDAGQTWTYNALFSGASEATSATSVVYNAAAGLFFAALRYHGFYSSADGLTWTLLANEPGAGSLSTTACPQNYVTTCPIYRGEITVVPGRNEMYVWFVSLSSTDNPADEGIWQSTNGGASWTQINDSGIINCGSNEPGCGVEQGFYNLELLAVPNGTAATDLYAGAINLYKCSINTSNPTCANTPFMNLTHVYGCDPLSALAHVHPDQHALAYIVPPSGADLMYFANDGGVYRALDGFTGLSTGSCSGTNQFDDLNQNLGSMTQFVGFSQNATDPDTLLGGTQDNGSPATATATTSSGWGNVLGGDGGYSAIDPNTGNWFASNPDTGSGTLNIQECPFGVSCDDRLFNVVVSSSSVRGDDGAFYFPYILDPQSATSLLVGTCRVWSGPRSGGAFTLLSPNFDTLGTGTCTGTEVNVVRALAAGGPIDANGSQVIYATTDGLGPNDLSTPVGGNVWGTTNATAVSGTVSNFANLSLNGPSGSSINPNQFPISSVAIDASDATGDTASTGHRAYVTVMGFTGGPGHVWQTTDAGTTWTDWTGFGKSAPLPDSPVNAVVVDRDTHIVYVGTDVGVFQSPTFQSPTSTTPGTSEPTWTEVGPASDPQGVSTGLLPNVAVTALAIFKSPCQKLLRASTYGRGIWQFSLPLPNSSPNFCLTEPNPFPTVNAGSTTTEGPISVASINGFTGTVKLSCSLISGSGSCSANPTSVSAFPATSNVTVNATTLGAGSYQMAIVGTSGSIANTLTVPFNVGDYQLSGAPSISINAGSQSTATLTITPSTFYVGSVNASCNPSTLAGPKCTLAAANPISVNEGIAVPVTATITVPSGAAIGVYNMTFAAQDTSGTPNHSFPFAVTVPPAPADSFQLAAAQAFPAAVDAGSQTTAKVGVTANYSGSVNAACDASALSGQCSVTPGNPVPISAGTTTALTLTVNIPDSAAPQPSNSYNVNVTVTDSSGEPSQNLQLPLAVIQDFTLGSPTPATQTITSGQSASYNFSVLPVGVSFANAVTFSCSGTPAISLCSFTPNAATPGNSSAAVVMNITTTSSSASLFPPKPDRAVFSYALCLALPWLALLVTRFRKEHTRFALPAFLLGLLLLALLLPSCGGGGRNGGGTDGGGGGGGGGGLQQGTQPGTYTITVTGTSGTLSHPAPSTITLIVN